MKSSEAPLQPSPSLLPIHPRQKEKIQETQRIQRALGRDEVDLDTHVQYGAAAVYDKTRVSSRRPPVLADKDIDLRNDSHDKLQHPHTPAKVLSAVTCGR